MNGSTSSPVTGSLRFPLRWILSALAWVPAAAILADAPASVAAGATGSVAAASIRMVGILALMIAAVVGGGQWLRRSRLLGSWKTPQARLSILETRSLGQRQALCLVACDHREWLVSVGPSGIQMLAPLQAASPRAGSFQEHLEGVAEFPAPRESGTVVRAPILQ